MAVSITAADLSAEIGGDAPGETTRATRLLAMATERVETYAPNAPEPMQNEAVIRYAGYFAQSDFGAVRSEEVGDRSVEYNMNHAAAFRNSGAEALLSRYKIRRAG